jgi:hypothetical protein
MMFCLITETIWDESSETMGQNNVVLLVNYFSQLFVTVMIVSPTQWLCGNPTEQVYYKVYISVDVLFDYFQVLAITKIFNMLSSSYSYESKMPPKSIFLIYTSSSRVTTFHHSGQHQQFKLSSIDI